MNTKLFLQIFLILYSSRYKFVLFLIPCCLSQLKEVCRRELDRSEAESTRNQAITSDYKLVRFSLIA